MQSMNSLPNILNETTPHYDQLILKLIHRRQELGMTQEHVNQEIGVADRLVSKWECGMKYPNFRHILLWASALNCRITIEVIDSNGAQRNG